MSARLDHSAERLRNLWTRRHFAGVRVENALAAEVGTKIRRYMAGLVDALKRTRRDADGRYWNRRAVVSAASVYIDAAIRDAAAYVWSQSEEFAGKWAGVMARTLVGRLSRKQLATARTHIRLVAARRARPPVREAGVTISLELDRQEIFRGLMDAVMSEIPQYMQSDAATFFEKQFGVAAGHVRRRVDDEVLMAAVNQEGLDSVVRRVSVAVDRLEGYIESATRTHVGVLMIDTEDMLLQYAGVVPYVVWTAILDGRVCIGCARLNGTVWAVSDRTRPQCPLHQICRCFWAPLLAGAAPPNPVSIDDWLRSQPDRIQKSILGTTRLALFRAGVPVGRFVNDKRQVIPVSKLPKPTRIPKSWKVAKKIQ